MESPAYSSSSLRIYLRLFKARWLPALLIFISVCTLGIIYTSTQKPIYEAEGKLRFRKTNATSSLTDTGKDLGDISAVAEKSNPIDTEAEVIRSVPVIQETITLLQLKDEQGDPITPQNFLKKLMVTGVKGTDVLKISYNDVDAKKAATAVNTLMQVYLKNNVHVNREEAVSARKFLEKQIPIVENNVHKSAIALREFKENNQIVALDREASEMVTQIHQLQQQINDIKAQIANSTSKSQMLRNKLGMNSEQAMAIATLSQSPAIQEVVAKIQQAESKLAIEKGRFTESNPTIVELEQDVANLDRLLQQRIQQVLKSQNQQPFTKFQLGTIQEELIAQLIQLEADNTSLASQISELATVQQEYQRRASNLPKLEQQLNELQNTLLASQSSYSMMLKKLQDIRVAENQTLGNVRIIANAVPPQEPISSRQISYLASALLGIMAASAAVYVLEATDKSIKTVDAAKKAFEFPWLGIIPYLSKLKHNNHQNLEDNLDLDISIPQLVVRDLPSSPITESYRMLQSNLKFLNSDRQIKKIVITSSASGEGKSTVAANLATSMAQAGHTVLLIDADMHNPKQHHIWDLNNDVGLSNVIAEQADPRVAIKTVISHLDVLTAGVLPPSPGTLLNSRRMNLLMDYFGNRYDFTIVDTPSLDFAADAPIMGRMADGILLVVRPKKVNSNKAAFANEILKQSGQNVLGIVVNGVLADKEPYNYYYHALENKPESTTQDSFPKESTEELWENISRLAQEMKNVDYKQNIDLEELINTPIAKLQSMIDYLQDEFNDLVILVQEEEEELSLQNKLVEELQEQVNSASDHDRLYIQEQLLQEQEKNRMLYKTIVGQRQNLEKRREVLRQYQEILQQKQNDNLSFN